MRKFIITLTLALSVTLSVHAIRYDLFAATGTYESGNPKADELFEWDGSITVNPEGYSFATGTSDLGGSGPEVPWYEVFFNGPQPFLTEVVYKAGNGGIVWLEASLADFNAGTYSSLRVHGDDSNLEVWSGGGRNGPRHVSYKGLSHGGLDGKEGVPVSDSGTTFALLAAGLLALAAFRSRRGQAAQSL